MVAPAETCYIPPSVKNDDHRMPLSATLSGPPATLASAVLPTRVRHLLTSLNALLRQSLEAPLQATLDELERALFDQAEHGHNGQLRQDSHQDAQSLRAQRGHFGPVFRAQLETALATIRTTPASVQSEQPATTNAAMQALTLVSDVDIDCNIVLHEIARREAIRTHIPLQLLGQRFGVLAARPAFEAKQLPMGPQALCRMLREAGKELQMGLDAQLALYRAFERHVLTHYATIVERANDLLTDAGVLPGLVYRPYPMRRSSPTATVDVRSAARAPDNPHPFIGQTRAASHSHSTAITTDGHAIAAPTAPAMPAQSITASTIDAPVDLTTLRSLLMAARRNATPATAISATDQIATMPSAQADASHPRRVAIPTTTLLQALGELQAQPPAHSTMGGLRGRRHIRDVQTALLNVLRSAHGPQATLACHDADIFDLLGLLYGEIEREVRSGTPAALLLERLQVPLVRAALQDPTLFVCDRHPARELLNAVAESSLLWLGDEDIDAQLLLKLNKTVDRVVEEYEDHVTVFEQAHQEIQAHCRTLAHKAEIAERRHIEAARGKERLALAKQTAGRSLERLCNAWQPPYVVQTLLQQAWSDILVLTLLRQGEDSDAWRERERLSERIAEITSSTDEAPDTAVTDAVCNDLLQIGYHQDEAAAIARILSTPGGAETSTALSGSDTMPEPRARLGAQSEDNEPPLQPRTQDEQAAYEHLLSLPFGTWFAFVTNQQYNLKRQRLSWYSPTTERALFVNQRGQKTADYSLDGLARLLAQGQARIITVNRTHLIDRAWQAAIHTLRTLAGTIAPNTSLEDA